METNTLRWSDKDTLQKLFTALKENKLIIGTTDTVLGLFSLATLPGFELLNQVKKRLKNPYLILVSSPDRINNYVNLEKTFHIENIVKKFWPGPLTIILRAKPGVPTYLVSEAGTIAFRMPNHSNIKALLEQTGDLFSTSANISGQSIPEALEQVSPEILNIAAYCVTNGKSETVPSTIIDCSNPKAIKVIREGAISVEQLQLKSKKS